MQKNENSENELFELVKKKNLEGLNLYIREHQVLNDQRKSDGKTPLHIAVEQGDARCADFLLKQNGLDQNLFDIYGKTPLYYALANDNDEMFDLLYKSNNRSDESNYQSTLTDLTRDSKLQGLIRLIHLMPAAVTTWESTDKLFLLREAIKKKHTRIVIRLLQSEIYQDEYILNKKPNEKENNPLQLAIESNYKEIVEALLKQDNIDLKITDKDENNILMLAVIHSDESLLTCLLSNENVRSAIDIRRQNNKKRTIIHLAVLRKDPEILKLLLEQDRVHLNSPDEDENTPLQLAVSNNQYLLAEVLLQKGADSKTINITDLVDSKVVELIQKHQNMQKKRICPLIPNMDENGRYLLTKGVWYASFVRFPSSTQGYHVALIIEGMDNNGKFIIRRYDCYQDNDKPQFAYIKITSQEGISFAERKRKMIEILQTKYYPTGKMSSRKIAFKEFQITPTDAESIEIFARGDEKKNAKEDEKRIGYSSFGKDSFSQYSPGSSSGHNCFTWTKALLLEGSIDETIKELINKDLKSVKDYIAAIPDSIYISRSSFFKRAEKNKDIVLASGVVGGLLASAAIGTLIYFKKS